MKRYIYSIIASALCAVTIQSCQTGLEEMLASRNDAPEQVRALTVNETKSELRYFQDVIWQDGDRISFFACTTDNLCYELSEGAGTTDGIFSKTEAGSSESSTALKRNYAVFPYNPETAVSSKGVITLMLPDTQSFVERSFSPSANTMVAVTPDKSADALYFQNLCGLLVFPVRTTYGIESITLRGNNGEKISGKARITPKYGEEPVLDMASTKGESITMECTGLMKAGRQNYAVFVVPPTVFENGITLTIMDIDGGYMTITTEKAVTVERNKCYEFSEFIYEPVNEDDYQYVRFEDKNFEKLILDKFDYNQDGLLSFSEAESIWSLSFCTAGISSLAGIEHFKNLYYLHAYGYVDEANPRAGDLTYVDLSANQNLVDVYITDNKKLEYVDLSGIPGLSYLDLSSNDLETVRYPENGHVENLYLNFNNIKEIKLPANPYLKNINAYGCKLTEFDPTLYPELETIYFPANQIRVLDISNSTKLYDCTISYHNGSSFEDMYIIMAEGQELSHLTNYSDVHILIKDQIYADIESVSSDFVGRLFTAGLTCTSECFIKSCPSWIELIDNQTDAMFHQSLKFQIKSNAGSESRSGNVVIANKAGRTHTITVNQNGETDWKDSGLWHSSLVIQYTSRYEGFDLADSISPYKYEHLTLSDAPFNYYFFRTDSFSGSNPTIDLRRRHPNVIGYDYTAGWARYSMEETESKYPNVTGFSISPTIKGNAIDIAVDVFAKEADDYRLYVFLSTNDGYYKNDVTECLTGESGHSFSASKNSVSSFHFSSEKTYSSPEKVRITVFVTRQYGDRPILRDDYFDNWYVDNSASTMAGVHLPLRLDGAYIGNGNEGITPGEDIEL